MKVDLFFSKPVNVISFVERTPDKDVRFAKMIAPEGTFVTVACDTQNAVIISTDDLFIESLIELAKLANYDFHYGPGWFECIGSNGYSEIFNKVLFLRIDGAIPYKIFKKEK